MKQSDKGLIARVVNATGIFKKEDYWEIDNQIYDVRVIKSVIRKVQSLCKGSNIKKVAENQVCFCKDNRIRLSEKINRSRTCKDDWICMRNQ